MSASESLFDKGIITDDEITNRLDYLAFLDDDDMSEDDRERRADEIEELAELKELVAAIGTDHSGLVSDDYWETYARNEADDLYDLEKTGAYKYFDYGSYADDLLTDYSSGIFHGTTYYYS